MTEIYPESAPYLSKRDIRFVDEGGRNIFLQVKWFKGDRRSNGELIIKEISITPRGGDILTTAIRRLITHPNIQLWGLNKVKLESIMDYPLFEKLKQRGWTSKPGDYSNLYWYVPGYKEPTFQELMGKF
jgi:hypothetical protein